MGVYDYRNTHPKPFFDLSLVLSGGTPGASGVPYVNTDPKAYFDAETIAAGGSATTGYSNTSPLPYITSNIQTISGPPPDTTPPDTIINSGPTGTVTDATQTFTFSSSEPASTFETNMDSAGWVASTSPKTYTLADGAHTFQVRATDAAGNTDPTPTSRSYTIDTTVAPLPPPGMSLKWSGPNVSDWTVLNESSLPGAYATKISDYIEIFMPGPVNISGDRMEIMTSSLSDGGIAMGDECYYEWEFYLPSGIVIPNDNDGYSTINQMKGDNYLNTAHYNGGIMITVDNEFLVRCHGGKYVGPGNTYESMEDHVFGTLTRDTWHKIGYHVRWDNTYKVNNPNGFARVYHNDVLGWEKSGIPTHSEYSSKVHYRLGWYPEFVPSGGLKMRVRNAQVWT